MGKKSAFADGTGVKTKTCPICTKPIIGEHHNKKYHDGCKDAANKIHRIRSQLKKVLESPK